MPIPLFPYTVIDDAGIFSSETIHSIARRMSHTCIEAMVRPTHEAGRSMAAYARDFRG